MKLIFNSFSQKLKIIMKRRWTFLKNVNLKWRKLSTDSVQFIRSFKNVRNEDFTAVKMEVAVTWVLTPCSDAIGYQRFGGLYWLHLQGEVGGALALVALWPTLSADLSVNGGGWALRRRKERIHSRPWILIPCNKFDGLLEDNYIDRRCQDDRGWPSWFHVPAL